MRRLLLHKAGVTGNALPASVVEHPRISEAPEVLIGMALVRSLGVVVAGDDGGIAEEVYFHILNAGCCRLELRIADVCEKLGLVADFTVILSVDEARADQGIERGRIAVNLRLVPEAFHDQEFAFPRIRLLSGQSDSARGKQKTATDSEDRAVRPHCRTRPPSSPREGGRCDNIAVAPCLVPGKMGI